MVVYALHENIDLGGAGADDFFDRWLNCILLWVAAALCLAGALRSSRSRTAWLLAALAIASWATGDTIWSIRFGDAPASPFTSISDVFWLAWYPLMIAALALLVRDRVPTFELHRWLDGAVVMLLVATPWVGLFLQPVSEHSSATFLSDSIEFIYPLGDAALVGAVVGVFALMGWRPGRMWVLLGLGLTLMGVADAIYSVQVLGKTYHQAGSYDAAWVGGILLVAYASWQPHPGRVETREVTGWRAIALPLAAQALALAVQAYGFFYELPRSERILTSVILVISMIKIVVSRPRAPE